MTASRRSLIASLDAPSLSVTDLFRVFLGGYFVYTGINKVTEPVTFLKSIRLFEMVPESMPVLLNSIAVILPWLEIVCGAALILGVVRHGAASLIAGMLCVFTPAVFLRALEVMRTEGTSFFELAFDCGCGTGEETIWIKLCKNVGLLLLAVLSLTSRSPGWSLLRLCRCGVVDAEGSKSTVSAEALPDRPATR